MKTKTKEDILKEFDKRFKQDGEDMGMYGWQDETGFGEVKKFVRDALDEIEKQIKDLVKQIVESVPVEEEDYNKAIELISKENAGNKEHMTCAAGEVFCNGYNYHVEEIKQWKKKMLGQLKNAK